MLNHVVKLCDPPHGCLPKQSERIRSQKCPGQTGNQADRRDPVQDSIGNDPWHSHGHDSADGLIFPDLHDSYGPHSGELIDPPGKSGTRSSTAAISGATIREVSQRLAHQSSGRTGKSVDSGRRSCDRSEIWDDVRVLSVVLSPGDIPSDSVMFLMKESLLVVPAILPRL